MTKLVGLSILGAVVAWFTGAPAWAGEERVTFSKDVAPIFNANCVGCHRPGEIAPFSLLEYETARAWAKSIRKVVHERTMPPWHADSEKTAFANDRSLDKKDIETIVAWVNQGARLGDPTDLPKSPVFNDTWAMGEPDMIFHAEEEFVIPAGQTEIEYQTVHFKTDLKEDLYITAWEIRPTIRKTVHHANLIHAPIKMKRVTIEGAVLSGGDYIGSYLPGARPMGYPDGMALRIPAGNHIQIQIHYVGLDEDVVARPMFGVRFAQGRVDKLIRVCGTGDDRAISIEPYDDDWAMTRRIKLLYDVTILSSGAHMHLRGKSYTATAILPDGTEKLIADVPRYDFNWQSNYQLLNPLEVPAGTVYSVEAHWDNSEKNPNVTNPEQKVVYGLWTDNEMLNSWSHIVLTNEKLGYKMKDGRVAGKFADAQDSKHPFVLQGAAGD